MSIEREFFFTYFLIFQHKRPVYILNLDQNSISDPVKRKELKTKRNKILTKIHTLIKAEETDKIENQLLCVENAPR